MVKLSLRRQGIIGQVCILPNSIHPACFQRQRIGHGAALIGRGSALDIRMPEKRFQQAMAAGGELQSPSARPAWT